MRVLFYYVLAVFLTGCGGIRAAPNRVLLETLLLRLDEKPQVGEQVCRGGACYLAAEVKGSYRCRLEDESKKRTSGRLGVRFQCWVICDFKPPELGQELSAVEKEIIFAELDCQPLDDVLQWQQEAIDCFGQKTIPFLFRQPACDQTCRQKE